MILTKVETVLKTLVLPLNTKLHKNQFAGSGVISIRPTDGRWHGTILISPSQGYEWVCSDVQFKLRTFFEQTLREANIGQYNGPWKVLVFPRLLSTV